VVAENPNKLTGRVAKKEATFFTDPLGVSDTTIATLACSITCCCIAARRRHLDARGHHPETTTEKVDRVSSAGYPRDWENKDYWDPSQFENPIAFVTPTATSALGACRWTSSEGNGRVKLTR
jgi:hypothetical protein